MGQGTRRAGICSCSRLRRVESAPQIGLPGGCRNGVQAINPFSPATQGQLVPPSLPYRPAVGVMLLNRQGLVFVGKRIDQTVEGWQMPQGGIDRGEEPREAALRELKEESGTDKARIIAEMEDWVTYDLPPHLIGVAFHGKYGGQRQKWFAMRFTGKDSDINLHAH